MRIRPVVAAISTAIAVVAIAVIVIVAGSRSDPPLGPLWSPDDGWTMTGIPADVDETVSVGVYVHVPGSPAGPFTLDRARLLEAPAGLTLDGVVVSTGRGESFACVGSEQRFPPPECRVYPLRGWVVNAEAIAHGFFQVVIGFHADRPGTFGYPGIALDYHDRLGSYRAILLQGAQVCAPREAHAAGCPDNERLIERQAVLGEDLAGS